MRNRRIAIRFAVAASILTVGSDPMIYTDMMTNKVDADKCWDILHANLEQL